MAKVLVIEDDLSLSRMIKDWLTVEHHNVETVADGNQGSEKLQYYQYDLVILDWQLPGMEGVQILKEFRNKGGVTPVLMLTGKNTIVDKEVGLDSGADDYLTKPFHMKELSARIRALLRRPTQVVGNILTAGQFKLDPTNHIVTKGGAELKLLPKEFALLEFLMRHPNQVFSADALLNRVWASESDATIDALTSCIKRLRKKIDADSDSSSIRTVHGVGYKLDVAD
ncbi:MAG TPA: response regulator transcription factor [Oculatellaceae cyanobacterium]